MFITRCSIIFSPLVLQIIKNILYLQVYCLLNLKICSFHISEGPLPASIRTWDTGLTLSGSPHSSKDNTQGMSGSHILAQIGRKTPTESANKSSSRHPSGSGVTNRTVAETKTSPKESSSTNVNAQPNKTVKREAPHGEDAAKSDGKKGEVAKHGGKKAKVNVPGGDELPTDSKTDNKGETVRETRIESDTKSSETDLKVGTCHSDSKKNETSSSATPSTNSSDSSQEKERSTAEKTSSVKKMDTSDGATDDAAQGTSVSLSSGQKSATGIPSISSPSSSASVPLSITIPAPSSNLMPPVSGGNNILVPSAQTVSTSSVTSTPIMSPSTSAKSGKGKHSPKSSKSPKLSSPVSKAGTPVSPPQSAESKKASTTHSSVTASPELSKKSPGIQSVASTTQSSQSTSRSSTVQAATTSAATGTTATSSSSETISTSVAKSVASPPVTGR